MHKHGNTTDVLTTEQKVFWKLSNTILHVIYRSQIFQRPHSRFMILKFFWYIWSVIWLPSYSVKNLFTHQWILYSQAMLPLWSCNSSKFTPFCSPKKRQYIHFTLFVGVSDSVDCLPSVHASRVLFSASVFCWSTTT